MLPLLESSRSLFHQFNELSTPSVLMVPAKIADPSTSTRLAFYSADDPMTIFVVEPTKDDADEDAGDSRRHE